MPRHTMRRSEWVTHQTLKFKNVGKDFSIPMKVLKKLPSGNLKVAEEVGNTDTHVDYVIKIAKLRKDGTYWVGYGGSVFNNYYYKPGDA